MRSLEVSPGRRVTLVRGDITRIAVDAIVNAANSALAGGGGVDGAIHLAGGQEIMAELDRIRPAIGRLPAGQAVATTAGRLPAQFVFHTVGPVWHGGTSGEAEALASCYRVCLQMAAERGLARISFPAISTGIYGYPFRDAAVIALRELRSFLAQPGHPVTEVLLVSFSESDYAGYDELLGG